MTGMLVHEWIAKSGGSENVLEAMADAFPDAPIFCLWNDRGGRLSGRQPRESWLANTPLRRHKALALPFTLAAWRNIQGPPSVEWVLASSHLFSHHVTLKSRPEVRKYVYAHSPARYLWNPELDNRGDSVIVRAAAGPLKMVDRKRAQEPVAIAANSEFVRARIERAWERDAVVIHPPVNVERITAEPDWALHLNGEEIAALNALPSTFALAASRFIPYKRIDLAIRAAALANIPLVVAGHGPEEQMLRHEAHTAGGSNHFVIAPSDAFLFALYQRASVFVFPAVEDFGIVPVEAQAAGTPVVTGPVGGQTETYTPGISGISAASTHPEDLAASILDAIALPRFDGRALTAPFTRARFVDNIRRFVQ